VSYTALSGQLGAMKAMEVTANNLANMTTPGFRAERVQFETVVSKEYSKLSAGMTNTDVRMPSYSSPASFLNIRGTFTDLSQGGIETSGNPLDVAIQGPGLFVVNTPDGERYTRAGNFTLDATGRLVTQQGHAVQGSSGDILINGSEVSVTASGEVIVDQTQVAQLRLVDAKPGTLLRESGMLFKIAEGQAVADVEKIQVQGGALEGSNVNAVRELTDMIMASRLFESFQKSQESGSRMSELRNSRVGSVNG
jgi:flagellar basal-body rod protein FlgF